MDTIFALASAQGKAGVAVIRVSGAQALEAVEQLCQTSMTAPSRGLRRVMDITGDLIDEALVLTFQGPHSFTGEDVVEFQTHGSTAVVSAVLDRLGKVKGLRLAEPGEFTRRALENGKLDLSQVEGLADLIDAETEAQRKQAQLVLSGALGDLADRWRNDLIRAASLIEVTIDFADEEVPVDVTPEVSELLSGVQKDLATEIAGVRVAERIRVGFEVAIVGAPNVGKSTLLNALAGREAAITSEYAGTTRDIIEVRMDLSGLPITLLDTAGLRDTEDHVESIGIGLAKQRAEAADLRVFLADPDDSLDIEMKPGDIRFIPKIDEKGVEGLGISGKTGQGIDALVDHVSRVLKERSFQAGVSTRKRHQFALSEALESLQNADRILEMGPEHYELVAEEIRSAIRSLEALVGRIGVEDLLDEIFSSFCLGK